MTTRSFPLVDRIKLLLAQKRSGGCIRWRSGAAFGCRCFRLSRYHPLSSQQGCGPDVNFIGLGESEKIESVAAKMMGKNQPGDLLV